MSKIKPESVLTKLNPKTGYQILGKIENKMVTHVEIILYLQDLNTRDRIIVKLDFEKWKHSKPYLPEGFVEYSNDKELGEGFTFLITEDSKVRRTDSWPMTFSFHLDKE